MHEMSLVQGLLQQLQTIARENNATKVLRLTMSVGPLAGVVIESFTFGFDILSQEDDLVRPQPGTVESHEEAVGVEDRKGVQQHVVAAEEAEIDAPGVDSDSSQVAPNVLFCFNKALLGFMEES